VSLGGRSLMTPPILIGIAGCFRSANARVRQCERPARVHAA
jgi:hypothetical protein